MFRKMTTLKKKKRPLLLVRKEVTGATAADDEPPLLLGQNLFRLDEPAFAYWLWTGRPPAWGVLDFVSEIRRLSKR